MTSDASASFKIDPQQMDRAVTAFKTTLQSMLTAAAAHSISYNERAESRLPAQFNEALNSIVPKDTRKVLDRTLHMFREHDPYAIIDMHYTAPVLHKLESMMGQQGRHADYASLFQTHTMRGLLDRTRGEFIGFYALRPGTARQSAKLDVLATPKSLDGTAYPLRFFVDACNKVSADATCNGLMEMDSSENITPYLLASRAMSRIFSHTPITRVSDNAQTGAQRVSVPPRHTINTRSIVPSELAPEIYMDDLYTRLNLRALSDFHRDMQFTTTPVHTTFAHGWLTYNSLWFNDEESTPASAKRHKHDTVEVEGAPSPAPGEQVTHSTADAKDSEDWAIIEKHLDEVSHTRVAKSTATAAVPSALASWDKAPKHVRLSSERLMTSLVQRRWDNGEWRRATPGAASDEKQFQERALDARTFKIVKFPYGIAELFAHGADNVPVPEPEMTSLEQVPYYGEDDYERAQPLLTTTAPVPLPLFASYNGVWYMLDGGHRLSAAAVRRSTLEIGVIDMSLVKSVIPTVSHPDLPDLFLTRRNLSAGTELYEVLASQYRSRILPSVFHEKQHEFRNLSLSHPFFEKGDAVGSKMLRLPDVKRGRAAALQSSVTRVMDQDSDYVGQEGVVAVSVAATAEPPVAPVQEEVVPMLDAPTTASESSVQSTAGGIFPPVIPAPPGQSGEAAPVILGTPKVSWEYLRNHAPVVHGVLGREWTNENLPFQVNFGEQQVFAIGDLSGFDILHNGGKQRYMDYLENIPWGDMITEVNGNTYDTDIEFGAWGVDPVTGRPGAMSLVNDAKILDALSKVTGAIRLVSPGTAADDKENPAVAGVFVRIPELKLNGITLKSEAGFWFRAEEDATGGARKRITLGNNVLKELQTVFVSKKGLSVYRNLVDVPMDVRSSCVMCGAVHGNSMGLSTLLAWSSVS